MSAVTNTVVQTWSTGCVPPAQRAAYYQDTCLTAMIPFALVRHDEEFNASIEAVDLGGISLMRCSGTAHTVRSDAPQIGQQSEACFNVVASRRGSWHLTHRGTQALGRDVGTFTDSRLNMQLEILGDYDFVNLKLPTAWTRQWLVDPTVLVGRRFTQESPWARALTSFIIALTPESIVAAPLPTRVVADQLGALLALVADELAAPAAPHKKLDVALSRRIEDTIRQRCGELSLCAESVAGNLNISQRTLHRHLASRSLTFGGVLQSARISVAAGMLASPRFRRFSTSEIGLRSGFANPSHFARVFARVMGCPPLKFRHGQRGT